ncbi:MAG: hypothetical protein J7524_22785 [Roseofilum sp. Belize BBD 4]|uniref:hypothetical protein n=1 Tax=Roseofilum sp. Belize BBD 4 TaxID=2821500 RepID=UPI001B00D2EA|nr:hypothetical protein [Roseofilum sp. Belize BBD 4]MBP0035950.1 hypothetical protein [Roseofilum sp. Belize BBD 4]
MTIILENLEPEILEKLQNKAISHGRTVTEEIKVILTEELVRDNEQNLTKKMDQSEWHKFTPLLSLWEIRTNFRHYSPRSLTKESGFHAPLSESDRRGLQREALL